jgi:hypothetical protein
MHDMEIGFSLPSVPAEFVYAGLLVRISCLSLHRDLTRNLLMLNPWVQLLVFTNFSFLLFGQSSYY